jgi:hypothetical protein
MTIKAPTGISPFQKPFQLPAKLHEIFVGEWVYHKTKVRFEVNFVTFKIRNTLYGKKI